MLLQFYYSIKPYLPLRLRYWLRGQRARRLRIRHADTWPIDQSAGTRPAGWKGWPGGKQFAFVLTHDVEGPAGYEKVRALADVEESLGFRSAFHFVPEGTYTVSKELRDELTSRGFEVGVHDLHHDGSLYSAQENFQRQAPRIKHYLKEWEASGFRAGFMFHNLEWIAHLGCSHDMSTFDTDPFEPQNDGVNTIFPFVVERGSTGGSDTFVELPYTLPQDSTLFLILNEQTPDIWLRKLDWLAEHGGMALVNVHPDYLRFPGEGASCSTYPLSHYTELLKAVSQRFGGSCWKALPREVASWVRTGSEARAGEGITSDRSPTHSPP